LLVSLLFLQEPWLAFFWLPSLLVLAALLLLAYLLLLVSSTFWHPFLLVLLFFDVASILLSSLHLKVTLTPLL
jgi:hypothetical protein